MFGASIVAYLITRAQSASWRPTGMPGLPAGLSVSSALVIAISVSLETARAAVLKNRPSELRLTALDSILLVFCFLVAQVQNWRAMHAAIAHVDTRTLFPYTFYMLTGLHALHVVGGLRPLGHRTGSRSASRVLELRHEGLRLCIQYWHFLTAVWAVLFVVLELGST